MRKQRRSIRYRAHPGSSHPERRKENRTVKQMPAAAFMTARRVAWGCGLFFAFLVTSAPAQEGFFTRDAVIKYTPEWKGERFDDGRPKVPDAILDRMKKE